MISILANVGNAGFALPMVSAYPTDVNQQQVLAWDPVAQALDYVDIAIDALGNWVIPGTLEVQGAGGITTSLVTNGVGTLSLAGGTLALNASTSISAAVGIGISNAVAANAFLSVTAGGTQTKLNPTNLQLGPVGTPLQVVAARRIGWATATGAATRTTYDTATVTLPQLAERVKALIDDLHSTAGHGLIGP